MIRDLRGGAPGAFLTVWNGLAPDVWSVLLGVLDDEALATGWATTFRLELAQRVVGFHLDEPLSVQVGRVLLEHVAAGLGVEPGPLPQAASTTPDETLRTLPPTARLHYLVDLFFHVQVSGVDDLALLRLMEPGQHTDARRTAQSLLQRLPPDNVLLYPPGAAPPQRAPAYQRTLAVAAGVVALLVLLTTIIASRPHTVDWAAATARTLLREGSAGVTLGSDPEALSLTLIRGGARVVLVEIPDLSPEGLQLIGATDADAGTDDEAVVAFYTSGTGEVWTLQHTAARLPDDAATADTRLVDHAVADLHSAAWPEPGGSWILTGPGDAVGLATHIRDRRKATGP